MISMPKKKAKKVVLIEDEQTLTNLIELGLKEQGYEVQTAKNGKAGLALILKSKPDLVLLDMMLPALNGFDILEKLGEKHILPDLPIIIISNSGQPIEIEKALKLGVRDYLIKVNFDPNEVLAKVQATFEMEAREEPRRKKEMNESQKTKNSQKVLLVEDDTILADSLKAKFQERGYTLYKATNAKEARSILKKSKVDIILLDLILPDIDGFHFLRELKADEKSREIPIIIVSNLGQREEVEKGKQAGAQDFIVKSNTVPGEIADKVEAVLQK